MIITLLNCGNKTNTASITESNSTTPPTNSNPITSDTKEEDSFLNKIIELK